MIEEEPNPLWMPRGSVRALLTIGLTSVSAAMVLMGTEVPEWWQAMTAAAVAGYGITRAFAPRNITVREPVNLDDADLLRRGNA